MSRPICHLSCTGHFFHPLCSGLSGKEQAVHSIVSAILATTTLGIFHIHHYCKEYQLSHRVESFYEDMLPIDEAFCQCCNGDAVMENMHTENVSEETITQLMADYRSKEETLINLLDNIGREKNPWINPTIGLHMDGCIKSAFLIGILTLKNLDSYIEQEAQKGNAYSRASALTTQNSFRYRAFFLLPKLYQLCRGSLTYVKDNSRGILSPWLKAFYAVNRKPFYSDHTRQFQWRKLYNTYCDSVYSFVKTKDLEQLDPRFTLFTKQDLHPCTYDWNVGTPPT